MLYGRLLDKNTHRCETLADFSNPVVLLQSRKSGGDRFVECVRGHLDGVLNVSNILYRNCARSLNHTRERSRIRLLLATGGLILDLSALKLKEAHSHSGSC